MKALEDELNFYLAREYGVKIPSPSGRGTKGEGAEYEKWLASHKPFHWFIEFYGIMKDGGFDVIIGNPPYVEYSKVRNEYTIRGYETESCGNLYAFVIERNYCLLSSSGKTGMIIPHSAICTDRMESLISLFYRNSNTGWFSTYCIRPSKLFIGVDQRLAIYLIQKGNTLSSLYSSNYHRWHDEFRPHLFSVLEYINSAKIRLSNSMLKIQNNLEEKVWNKLVKFDKLDKFLARHISKETVYFHNAPRYWIRAMDFAPYFWNERDGEQISTQVKSLHFTSKLDGTVAVAIMNSSIFYWWFIVLSDCRHLNLREIENFPIGLDQMTEDIKQKLVNLSTQLMKDFKQHSQRKECYYQSTGKVAYDEFYPKNSKPIIDEIDRVLAEHYGFTDEELDFIINYDIKYRMGREGGENDIISG